MCLDSSERRLPARSRVRRDRDRRHHVEVRGRHRPGRPARDETTFPTTTPEETIDAGGRLLRARGAGRGARGRLVRPGRPAARPRRRWGHITTTPKPGWAHTDVAPELGRRLGVPVAFDTDVNAAALGEHRWGAARGLDTFCLPDRRHRDRRRRDGRRGSSSTGSPTRSSATCASLTTATDPFPGFCPYHGDCWEGLAAGPCDRGALGQAGRRAARRRRGLGARGALPRARPRLRDLRSSRRSGSWSAAASARRRALLPLVRRRVDGC